MLRAIRESKAVEFEADDGVMLQGRWFGKGPVGVVLSHMGNRANNQSDWFGMALELADHGFRVLTYNSRGVCPGGQLGCSERGGGLEDRWLDVLGAV